MRDGVTLSAVALVPADTTRAYPILLVRTPFGAARELRNDVPPAQFRELAEIGRAHV